MIMKTETHYSIRSVVVASLLACFAGGCATITKDDSQPVAFRSEPQGAVVSINNIPRGTTPTTIMIKRSSKRQMIRYELEGYRTETFRLGKSVSGMTVGNIIFGGLIGAGVDIASGKATNYEDSVHVKMIPLDSPEADPAKKEEEKPNAKTADD